MPTSPNPTLNSHAEMRTGSRGIVFHTEVKRLQETSTVKGTSVSEMRPETPFSDPPTTVSLLAEDIVDIETLADMTREYSEKTQETIEALAMPEDSSTFLTESQIDE